LASLAAAHIPSQAALIDLVRQFDACCGHSRQDGRPLIAGQFGEVDHRAHIHAPAD
jgi:hypothetical protein